MEGNPIARTDEDCRLKSGDKAADTFRMPLRRRFLTVLTALLATALVAVAPAGAIMNGQPDSTHGYVGLLFTEIDGDLVPVCSGALIAPQVFLTAAHCTDFIDGGPAFVSFDQQFGPGSTLVAGTAVENPDFGTSFPNTHDIAVVLLDESVTNVGFAALPEPGLLNELVGASGKSKLVLTIVGYGAEGFSKGGGPSQPIVTLRRTSGTSKLINLTSANAAGFNMQISNNPGHGRSGICFGDSGGPVLVDGTIVAINSFVNNAQCAGNAFAYRVDTEESLDFLAPDL
jgi:hypothetical protein